MNIDQMPHSPESERAILGSILLDPILTDQARRELPAEMFYVPSYREMYLTMLAMHERNLRINSITLADELRKAGLLESVGDMMSITNLTHGLPPIKNLKPYIDRVKEAASRRRVIRLADHLAEQALDESIPVGELMRHAAEQIDNIRGGASEQREPQSLEALAEDQLLRYELFFKGITGALPTGFPDVDRNLLGGGLMPSSLCVIGAGTSIGKTSFALDIAANIVETGRKTYIVSREMPCESLFDRLVAFEAQVPRRKLGPGICEKEYRQAQAAVVRLAIHPLILDNVSRNVADIRGYLREYERKGQRAEAVFVDYLQLLDGTRTETRNQEVGSISRALKGLAMEFCIPVVAACQLKRIRGREPALDDLRDSGEIEQDADTVLFLYGDPPEADARFYSRTLKCAKQRDGALFKIDMPFNGELVTYRRAASSSTEDDS